jgi:hypothetical protein
VFIKRGPTPFDRSNEVKFGLATRKFPFSQHNILAAPGANLTPDLMANLLRRTQDVSAVTGCIFSAGLRGAILIRARRCSISFQNEALLDMYRH